jgi:hypothetical protein
MTQEATDKPSSKKRQFPQRKWLVLISITSLAILASGGWWLTHRDTNLSDVNVIMKKVSKHYALPANEMPALATITDSSKVQSNFSAKVKDDDKVLIYENNKKAIVYRPSLDRIVDVEPVTVSNQSNPASTTIPNIKPFGN